MIGASSISRCDRGEAVFEAIQRRIPRVKPAGTPDECGPAGPARGGAARAPRERNHSATDILKRRVTGELMRSLAKSSPSDSSTRRIQLLLELEEPGDDLLQRLARFRLIQLRALDAHPDGRLHEANVEVSQEAARKRAAAHQTVGNPRVRSRASSAAASNWRR